MIHLQLTLLFFQTSVDETLSKHLVEDPRETTFFAPFLQLDPGLSAETAVSLRKDAEAAIKDHVQPGMRKIRDFLRAEYKTRPEIGASSLPNGTEFYKQCIRFHTSTELTAQEIHDIGLREVERIENDMKKVRGAWFGKISRFQQKRTLPV